MPTIKLYGTDWCEDTQATRHQLDAFHIPYDYINIDNNPAAKEWVIQVNGKQRTPTLNIDGLLLTEPTEPQLKEALRQKSLLP
jgi:glutaredoxin